MLIHQRNAIVKRILSMTLALAMLSGCGLSLSSAPTIQSRLSRLSARAIPTVFNFQGFKPAAGTTLTASATYNGISAKGTAEVKRFDGSNIDLMVHVKKLFIKKDVHILLEGKEDGTVHSLVKQVGDSGSPDEPNEVEGVLKVKSVSPNQCVFLNEEGQDVTVSVQSQGGKNALTIKFGDSSVTVQ